MIHLTDIKASLELLHPDKQMCISCLLSREKLLYLHNIL